MNLEKSIYIILYRMLWNKILQVELEGKIPTEARDADYSPLVFYHAEIDNKPLNDFLFFFPFDTRKTSEKFFYKKYRQAVTGTEEISIDYEILYNALHYLGYRLDHIEEKDYVEKWSVKNTKLLLTKFKADIADEDIPGRLITEPDTTPIYTEDIETIMLSIIKKMNKQKDSPKDFQTLLDAIRFEDDTENLIKRFAFLRNAYPDELPYLLRNGEMVAPYTIIHDYRKENLPGWGTYNFVEQFEPCSILKAGYEDAINRNKEALKKGNLPVVRVNDINQENNNLELTVQKAMYYDQVASSLEV
ncbi:MAG: hypothetical protein ACTHMC_02845, partial [Pseudobacter sp.]|uniref:hypothetical protein n=1 Tax=Pseudobacter sp. TaxID=2045420 RepID=UPI003F7E5D81